MTQTTLSKRIFANNLISSTLSLITVSFFFINCAFSQKPVGVDHPTNLYFKAFELYTKQKYNAAADVFNIYITQNINSPLIVDAKFYKAVCGYELLHPDAYQQFDQLSKKYPNHSRGLQSAFYLAKILFRDKKYKELNSSLSNIDIASLDPEDEAEFWFIKGFSAYKTGMADEAIAALANVALDSNKYFYDANYYKSYLHYLRLDYDLAEQGFKRIVGHAYYGQVAPLYLSQIYIKQNKYAEALALTDTISRPEILYDGLHIAAISAYHIGDYNKSSKKYEAYYKASKPMSDSDWYMAGKSHLNIAAYEPAIYNFNKIKPVKDSFYHTVVYDLAYTYFSAGLKENARSAFYIAYQYKSISDLTEEAGYHYNILSVALNAEDAKTIESLNEYITRYPQGTHAAELKDMLSGLLLNSKQYQKTLDMLLPLGNKSDRIKTVIQKSAFCKGEEFYASNNLTKAEELFNLSLEYNVDKRFEALASYWLAEITYKEHNYEKASKLYGVFLTTQESKQSVHYSTCYYNSAWCFLKLKNYSKAATFFYEFNKIEDYLKPDQNMLIDGHVRLADCRFMLREYESALEEYNWVITKDNLYHDYALYQKAVLYGLMKMPYERILTLKKIVDVYEESDYLEKALYELGVASFYLDKLDDALEWFNQLLVKRKNGTQVRRAQLNLGLIYKRQNKNGRAIEQFEYLIKTYTQSEEAKEALAFLKQLYIESGNITEFNAFVQSIPGLKTESIDNETDIYDAITRAIDKEDTANAIQNLNIYIKQFPEGQNILQAHSMRAEIYYKSKRFSDALIDYEWIAAAKPNEKTERAIKNSSSILFSEKKYPQALNYFVRLEQVASKAENILFSLEGQLACLHKNRDEAALKVVCQKILARKDIKTEIRDAARYDLAGILYKEDKAAALNHYRDIVRGPKTIQAAEAKYMIARIQFDNLDSLGTKKTIKELNRDYGDFEFWVAKGFILLADDYILMRDTFQAKATLNSIIENFEPDIDDPEDIRKIAMEKLAAIQFKETITPIIKEEDDKDE